MSYLSQATRQTMREAVLNHAFQAKEEAAKNELIAAGVALYMSVHADYLPAMRKLPSGFCYKSSNFKVNIGGQAHDAWLDEARLMAHQSYNGRYPIEANNPFGIAYLQANDKKKDLEKQRKSMSNQVTAILESVRTFKKLWEVWPEAKPILEKYEAKPPAAYLPAIQFDKVNAALGLPPDTTDLPWSHRMSATGAYEIGYFGPNGFVKTDEAATLDQAKSIVDSHNNA